MVRHRMQFKVFENGDQLAKYQCLLNGMLQLAHRTENMII